MNATRCSTIAAASLYELLHHLREEPTTDDVGSSKKTYYLLPVTNFFHLVYPLLFHVILCPGPL